MLKELRMPPDGGPANRISFRPARLADLAALHAACFAKRPLAQFGDAFRRSLREQRAGRRLHLVGMLTGEVVASGQLTSFSNLAEIADLAVAPAYRGQGIGTALIAVLETAAQLAGYTLVELSVMEENRRARALYHKLGFVEDRTLSLRPDATVFVLRKTLKAPSPTPGVFDDK